MRGFRKHGSKYYYDRHEKQREGSEQTRVSEDTWERLSDDTTHSSRKHKSEDYCDRHGKQRRNGEQTHFSEYGQHSPDHEIPFDRTIHDFYEDHYDRRRKDGGQTHFSERSQHNPAQEIFSFGNCEWRLRQLTIHIKKYHSLTLPQQEELNAVLQQLEHYLAQHEKLAFYQWEQAKNRHFITQSIAFLLYNCGQLAAFIRTPLAASSLQFLLERLLNQKNLAFQSISPHFDQRTHATNTPMNSEFRRTFDGAGSRSLGKCISNSLHGLGLLAEHHKLKGMITAQPCLDKLIAIGEENTQHISNSSYGIGRLAAEHLQDMINPQSLLEKLITLETTDAQAISNGLYSMGQLAAAGRLQGIVTAKPFVEKLITLEKIDAQAICNSIYALGLLVKAKKLGDSVNWNLHISHLLSFLCAKPLLDIAAHQVLFGLAALAPATSCDPKYLQQLFQCVMTNGYLHPRELAKLINYFVVFKSDYLALDEQFQTLLSAITIPFKGFPKPLQEQLKNNIAELSNVGNWQIALQSRLGLSQPTIVSLPSIPSSPATKQPEPLRSDSYRMSTTTVRQTFLHRPSVLQPLFATQQSEYQRVTPRVICPPPPPPPRREVARPICQPVVRSEYQKPAARLPVWEHCRQHPVFKAIADKDLNELQQLLGLRASLTPSRAHHVNSEASPSVIARLPHPVAQQTPAHPPAQPELSMNHRATAHALAQQFFKRTDATALRQLIAESTHTYFEAVLHACSHHVRYQLAITNALHPIILYLPMAELTKMVQSLRHLELYRDHKALLNLLDALTLRMLEHPDRPEEHALIRPLRQQFFDIGLTFHEKTNHHHVTTHLQAVQAQLAHTNQTFIDNIEEESFVQPTPVESTFATTQSVVARSTQTIAASRPTLFSAESPRPTRPLVNTAYEYNTNDMQVILGARFNEHANVSVLAAANMTDSATHNRVADVLSQFMQAGGLMGVTEERNILIPIVVAHHWVGIRLRFIPQSPLLTITYYNSSSNPDVDSALKLKILQNIATLQLCRALSLTTIDIQTASQCLQQDDATSCGPFLIENMYCDITRKQWDNTASKPLEERIRIRHLDILQQRRPDYCDRFKQQQTGEAPSTGLRIGFER